MSSVSTAGWRVIVTTSREELEVRSTDMGVTSRPPSLRMSSLRLRGIRVAAIDGTERLIGDSPHKSITSGDFERPPPPPAALEHEEFVLVGAERRSSSMSQRSMTSDRETADEDLLVAAAAEASGMFSLSPGLLEKSALLVAPVLVWTVGSDLGEVCAGRELAIGFFRDSKSVTLAEVGSCENK